MPFFAQAAEKRLDMYSASSAFFIFISFIPFTLILLSTVKYLPYSKQDILTFVNEFLPTELNSFVVYVIEDLYGRGIGTLSLSILAAVWASAKGILGITKGLNEIHGERSAGNFLYLRTRSAICTLLLMVGMILLLVISVFGNSIRMIIEKVITMPAFITNILDAGNLIMWAVLFLLFMFLFCVLPAGMISVRSQIPGAAVASFLWILFTKLFSFYLSTFHGYSMYGSFAVILVMGVWLYTGMYIMFMGAFANHLLVSRKG